MTDITRFVFTPFQENTYVVYDDTKECVIIDPGCYETEEQEKLTQFIESQELQPVKLLNTHCHIDHIAGNKFVAENYDLSLYIHQDDEPILQAADEFGKAFGFTIEPSPEPAGYLAEGDIVEFGNTKLEVMHTPGHSPGSISFYQAQSQFIVSGDVLFLKGMGRYDLPGGDLEVLKTTILQKFFPLAEDVTVYSGHGPETTIGFEKNNNPFFN